MINRFVLIISMSSMVIGIALVVFAGYVFSIHALGRWIDQSTLMAFPAAVAFLLNSVSIILLALNRKKDSK